jgi:hypothetical protein
MSSTTIRDELRHFFLFRAPRAWRSFWVQSILATIAYLVFIGVMSLTGRGVLWPFTGVMWVGCLAGAAVGTAYRIRKDKLRP